MWGWLQQTKFQLLCDISKPQCQYTADRMSLAILSNEELNGLNRDSIFQKRQMYGNGMKTQHEAGIRKLGILFYENFWSV